MGVLIYTIRIGSLWVKRLQMKVQWTADICGRRKKALVLMTTQRVTENNSWLRSRTWGQLQIPSDWPVVCSGKNWMPPGNRALKRPGANGRLPKPIKENNGVAFQLSCCLSLHCWRKRGGMGSQGELIQKMDNRLCYMAFQALGENAELDKIIF